MDNITKIWSVLRTIPAPERFLSRRRSDFRAAFIYTPLSLFFYLFPVSQGTPIGKLFARPLNFTNFIFRKGGAADRGAPLAFNKVTRIRSTSMNT